MIIVQPYGISLAIGGDIEDITPLHWAVYNHGGTDSNELIEMSDNFQYFIVDEQKYLKARASAFAMNWKWSYKGIKGGCWPFAMIKAKKELASFKQERFLPYYECHNPYEYKLGTLSRDLFNISEDIIYDLSNLKKENQVQPDEIKELGS